MDTRKGVSCSESEKHSGSGNLRMMWFFRNDSQVECVL
jgi:hypothetical protein